MVDGYPWGETVPNGTDLEFMYRWSEKYSENDWFELTPKREDDIV